MVDDRQFRRPPQEAFTAYAKRWGAETLFGALKSRGFNLEGAHLPPPERLDKLLALAFAWTYRTGEALAEQQPTPLKKPPATAQIRFPLWSRFIRAIVLDLPERWAELLGILEILSCS